MIAGIAIALSPFVLNALTALVVLVTGIDSNSLKRVVLAPLSLVGIVATSAVSGNPIDPSSVTSVVQTLAEVLVAFLMSHGSYTLFFKSKTA